MDGTEAVKYGLVDGLLDKRGDLVPKPAAKG
jgi:ATP-dependent protease ClpP protease subunit